MSTSTAPLKEVMSETLPESEPASRGELNCVAEELGNIQLTLTKLEEAQAKRLDQLKTVQTVDASRIDRLGLELDRVKAENDKLKNLMSQVAAGPAAPDRSPTIGKLAMALAKAQATSGMGAAAKLSQGQVGQAKVSYANLDSVIQACKPLAANGLALTQLPSMPTPDTLALTTVLMHAESGEYIQSTMSCACGNSPQEKGKAITYLRRYALMAMCGIAAAEPDELA